MTSNGHALTHCLACNSTNLSRILDFGHQPLANSYVDIDHLSDVEYMAPLGLNYCVTCSHLQLPFAVDPDLMFRDYSYVSGTSQTLRDYFDWFARFSCEYYFGEYSREHLRVLDIACNDGSQLDSFKKLGHYTLGVDPARNLFDICARKGHVVQQNYLNEETVKSVLDLTHSGPDIINAQNVFAHNANPVGFLRYCRAMMNDDTLLFIQNSQADMIKNGEFDTIYHEHHSFWNLASMTMAAARSNLNVIDRVRTPIHGISDLFVLSKRIMRPSWHMNGLLMEDQSGLHSEKTLLKYADRVKQTISHLAKQIDMLYANKYHSIVGYGAAAKGNTLLNAAKIDLDCIIDDNL